MKDSLLNMLEAMEFTGIKDSRILHKAIRGGEIKAEMIDSFRLKIPKGELVDYMRNKTSIPDS